MVVDCPTCGSPLTPDARFCATCGNPVPAAAGTGEERKVVTVLFADVTGSTSLGEHLDPERLRALLGAYFGEMTRIIGSWGGIVEKYIGDAIMAVFGVPAVREDDAERALRAAMEMGERLALLNDTFERDHGVRLEMRIGVNTGEVVAPGGSAPEQLIVTGDAVNVAARLEQAAEPGTILVGDRTRSASRFAFSFGEQLRLELKGKAAPVVARRLISALPEAQRGVQGLRAPMIGRDRELATLMGVFEEATETARPRMIVVFGPAGIGKSRLSSEFLAVAHERYPAARVLRGRCLAAGHGITYWALAEILRGALGIGLADPADEVRGRLLDEIGPMLAPLGLSPAEVGQTIAALATTAGIGLDENDSRQLTAEDLARAWPRFATAFVAAGPAIWVVEDLHWAGEPVLEMLQRIASRTDGPLVVLATARPEFAEGHPAFAAWGGTTSSISLRPLTDAQSEELLGRLLEVAELPDALRAEILAKAEGNPFFVEEIIQRLIDEGAVVLEAGHWRATGAATAPIPDSVHALVAARIDALAAVERRVLQEAAVVGRTFWAAPIELAVTGKSVGGALAELERKGLIMVRPKTSLAEQTEYMFKHALVRDVAYASLPKARRAKAHAEVGGWIESISGERADEFAELVAHHYLTAVAGDDADLAWLNDPQGREELRRKAFQALLSAGRAARTRFATPRAVELHEQAISLASSDAERLDAYEQLAGDHDVAFHGDEALVAYQQALEIARQDPGEQARVAVLARRASTLATHRGGAFREPPDHAAVDALIEEGLRASQDRRERAALLMAQGAEALWRSANGQPDPVPMDKRMEAAREASQIAGDLGDAALQASAAATLTDLAMAAGEYGMALREVEGSMRLLEEIQAPSAAAAAYFEAGHAILNLQADARRAIELAERSGALAKDLSPHEQMHATSLLMTAAYRLGDWDRVEASMAAHLSNFDLESSVRCLSVQSGVSSGAIVVAHRGDAARALELVRRPRPFEALPGPIEGMKAQALVAAGSIDEGLALARTVLDTAPRWRTFEAAQAALHGLETIGDWETLGRLAHELDDLRGAMPYLDGLLERAVGRSHAARGETDAGMAAIRWALARFEKLSAPFEAGRTREMLADLVPADEARRLLVTVLASYRRLGASPHASRVEGRLAAL